MEETRTQLEALGELARILGELGDGAPLPAREELAQLLEPIHPADLADLVSAAPPHAVQALFEAIPSDEDAAEVLTLVDEGVREALLEALPTARKAELLQELAHDDAADVLSELSADEQTRVLAELPAQEADELRALARHPADSAGGLMNDQFVALRGDQTARAALMEVRTAEDWEALGEVFVVDPDGRLEGVVQLDGLLRAQPTDLLRDLADERVPARVDEPGEEAAARAMHYRVSLQPVVDGAGRLVGVISYDDVMETLGEEASEDMYRLAGTLEQDPTRAPLLQRLLHRFPFLLVTIAGTWCVAWIMEFFLGPVQEFDILRFVPMVAALAGNAGIQASTTMIRGFATGDIARDDFGQMFGREVWLGVLSGVAAGTVELLLLLGTGEDRRILQVVPLAQVLAVVLATALGTAIPFWCWRARFRLFGRPFAIDPALAAGPFITTLNDILSTTIAMLFATRMFR